MYTWNISISTQKGFVTITRSQFEGRTVRGLTILKWPEYTVRHCHCFPCHNGRQMNVTASQITEHWISCLIDCGGQYQREHQTSALLVSCEGNSLVTDGFP